MDGDDGEFAEKEDWQEPGPDYPGERLMEKIETGVPKMEGINSDKVNIHLGSGEGGGGAGAMAALVAALGNRNQGDNSAALIAAMGNRNQGDNTAALIAAMSNRKDNGFADIAALMALLDRRGDKDCDRGRDHDHDRSALIQSILESVADIRAQVPSSALEVTAALQRAIGELALGTQQGLSNLKDSVQAIGALNLSATQGVAKDVATGTLQTIIGIGNDGDKTRALITSFNNENLQRQLTVAQLDGVEHRLRGHVDNVENRVVQSTTVNTHQQQEQSQRQRNDDERFARLTALITNIGNQVQKSRSEQDIVNLGTMLASGTQTPTTTQVGR